ncbi:MAG: CCA tRNA nucleotidyltransferase [Abditibacteriota bacterium]|nr:CCA tRNA nucleotidyltransferase [Abditibacteriota bacterium]
MNINFKDKIQNVINIIISNLPEYKDKIYLVGGSVRDIILGFDIYDLDFVTEEDPFAITRKLQETGFGNNVTDHYKYGNSFIDIENLSLEFTRARLEGYDENSRFPHIFPGTVEEDAERRDFTVNSLMVNIYDREGTVIDFSHRGLSDLENKIIDTVTDPNESFYEDPLRMYRAVRFAGRFDFNLASRVKDAIKKNKDRVSIIPKSNIKSEIDKMNDKALDMMKEFNLPQEIK